MLGDIVSSIAKLFSDITSAVGLDALFFVVLAVEAAIAVFFLIKSMFSYEARANRALEKINFWLFEKKIVTEDNIKELNALFKSRAPKRICYFWQQYILFREGSPSSYLSSANLVDKPLKTSSYNSNIKNLLLISIVWALLSSAFMLIGVNYDSVLTGSHIVCGIVAPILIMIIAVVFIVFLRSRKNSALNALYQNTQLFGRFMDNACVDLPSYIDYQILFTPQEIENGQPVLREFLDYKARKEKEEFNRAKENEVQIEQYDFAETGVDGSMVLDRAMRESEIYLKKKERALLKISQFESELDSRRKNFDNVQKEFQTKIQASKENVDRLRQMQEETTNRIESNYYRKQQTQEIAKQEQLEQEFESQRSKYSIEKNECEEEIAKLNAEIENDKKATETAMLSEYQSFFNKFCQSAEKVVAKVFSERINSLKDENEQNKEYIAQLEIKLKNKPTETGAPGESGPVDASGEAGRFDENGNYIYDNGTFYDKDGNYHDLEGNVYAQDGSLISKAEKVEEKPEQKQVVNFDDFDAFDFTSDISQKDDIFEVAEEVIKDVDTNVEVVNPSKDNKGQNENFNLASAEQNSSFNNEQPFVEANNNSNFNDVQNNQEVAQNDAPVRKAGRPKKVTTDESPKEKRGAGRPKKIVKETETASGEKRGRGRPKKDNDISAINKKFQQEIEHLNEVRSSLNQDLQSAMNGVKNAEDVNTQRREEILKEIDLLQKEAQQVIDKNEPSEKAEEINSRLEALFKEIEEL